MSITTKFKPILSVLILVYAVKALITVFIVGFENETVLEYIFLALCTASAIFAMLYWLTPNSDETLLISLTVILSFILVLVTYEQLQTLDKYKELVPNNVYFVQALNLINFPLISLIVLTVFGINLTREQKK